MLEQPTDVCARTDEHHRCDCGHCTIREDAERRAANPSPNSGSAPAADLDLDAIEKRAAAATLGPWEWSGWESGGRHLRQGDESAQVVAYVSGTDVIASVHDDAFIAAARTDVPALVAEVRRLGAERDFNLRTLHAALDGAVADVRAERDRADALERGQDVATAALAKSEARLARLVAAVRAAMSCHCTRIVCPEVENTRAALAEVTS